MRKGCVVALLGLLTCGGGVAMSMAAVSDRSLPAGPLCGESAGEWAVGLQVEVMNETEGAVARSGCR